MNRVVLGSIIAVFILLAMLAGIIYYNKYHTPPATALKAIPSDAVFVLEGKLNSTLINTLTNSSFINNFVDMEYAENLKVRLNSFQKQINSDAAFKNKIEKEGITISVHAVKVDEFDFVYYLTNANQLNSDDINNKISLLFDSVENETMRNYVDVDVHDLQFKNSTRTFTYAVHADILIASSTPFLVEDALRQLKAGKPINSQESFKALSLSKNSSDLSFYINYKNLPKWISTFCAAGSNDDFDNIENFADWSKLGISLKNNSILLNGSTLTTDTGSFLNLFEGQKPENIKSFEVLPRTTAIVKAFSFSDRKKFLNKAEIYNSRFSIGNTTLPTSLNEVITGLMYDEYGFFITEPASSTYDNNCYCYFNCTNANETAKQLQQLPVLIKDNKNQVKVKSTTYRNHQVIYLPYQNLAPAVFGKSFRKVTNAYVTTILNYVFIGNSNAALRLLIDSYEDNKLLTNTKAFETFKKEQSVFANYIFFVQPRNTYYLLHSQLNKKWSTHIEEYRYAFEKTELYSYSIKNNNSNFETSVFINVTESKEEEQVNKLWVAQLDTPFIIPPQLIETNEGLKYIAIQDSANQLYMINNAGNILWKKQLDEAIIPPIYALDAFKNNNRQLAFTTKQKLYLLDMDGDAVSNFPIQLPADAVAPLSVIDYDQTFDYRLYIPCSNGTVYGYQPGGKPLPGWNFSLKNNALTEVFQYFKLNNVDYLLNTDIKGNMIAVDRTGKPVLKLTEAISKKPGTLYHRVVDTSAVLFSCIDIDNNIVKIDTASMVTRNKKYNERILNDYYILDINKDGKPDYIDVFDNEIYAADELQQKIFSYTAPEPINHQLVFFSDDRGNTLICFGNAENTQIYIINTKGKLLKGMPVKGTTLPVISDLNNDRMKKLITCSDSISVTVYDF